MQTHIKAAENPSKFEGIRPGWTIKVFQKIKEGEKTRVQAFEGMVIARKHGSENGGTITVRKVSGGFGVEKIFPVFLPTIDKVEIVKKSHVRRAKLYYLRSKSSKEIRRKIKTEAPVKQETVAV
ncbi:MAG: 50S ribosomal protein L19 [Candidatus Yanofskybacteria bacterium GW2011_GWA1_44_21]|uniref:50S ribosomal protein L19 n=3 Tax=Parcubacteria group TaxID=1794811 RepID=A0A0G0XJR5_9BACT|nr:MAG: 50S ribosomal protein L19 [Candidatus Wolfebacteria bacterium GW2011_GWA2_42_10]KKT50337.1 MAG: 50S ribosomal protein L19 [Candidatus Yanofskybacteria bacterium GW2011_GWA1_44_21]KKT90176.1 MAG: 50S ribosomal protein L19 [Candidatus Yanofskybacteria bacterium GW2011_GWB1_45_11]OGN02167.1 MAG: 50S ribosomal protein L19 [Candidatus Yanofskybacteria bacterium RIFCSPHIGHO2_01_FULL_44_110b]OGN14597.1 MAG: 50S ribosomal protein L19 [Candidatus Yanofskybacteria bacterium RIFCSPHIGHO2_02_FULL_4